MICIYTGKIRSGKTTRLAEWAESRDRAGGVLMPVRSGRRYFFNISSVDHYSAEADEEKKEIIRIGPHRFSQKGFDRANHERWLAAGGSTIEERAKDKVEEILGGPEPGILTDEILKRVHRITEQAEASVQRKRKQGR